MVNTLKTKEQPATELEVSEAGRKRMETALRESEAKYSALVENSADGIVIIQDGVLKFASPISLKLVGYRPEELVGTDFIKIITPENQKKVAKRYADRMAGKEVPNLYEISLIKKNGTTVPVEINATLIDYEGRPADLVLIRDITERKQAEEALRESEEKFSKAFHASPDIIAITTLKDGKIIEVNDSFTRISGYTREDVTGHTPIELDLWPKSEQRDRIYKKLREQGQINQEEVDMRDRAGEIRTGLFSAEPINVGSEPCIISVITDITERKRVEEALRESEEKFSKAFRASPDMVTINTLEHDGIFLDVNDSFTRVTGYTHEEAIGRSSVELGIWVNKEDNDRIAKMLKEQGRIRNEEFDFRTKSGEIRVWLFSAERINIGGEQCAICVATDITELRRAEAALRDSEEKFSKAFRASPDMVTINTLGHDGIFLDVNDSFTRVTGYTREEVIGRSSIEVGTWVKKEDNDRIAKMLMEQGRVSNQESEFRIKSGEIRVWLFSAESINIGGEQCVICVTTDITELRRAEEKLKQALVNLEHANNQLAATNKELETFSYSVSHDLRSPLRTIDGFSQALLEDYLDKLDEQGQDYLSRLRAASQKMGELIDGLLKLSRLTRSDMHKEKVDLSALAEEITTRLQETQPERQAEFIISRGLTASGDRQLLRALLENLLGNAWKFTGKRPQARIEFGATHNGDKKVYFVRDNGAGFDMTYADKLFGAFQRLHETTEFPGTGIGLATVQRIINRHGGSVWAEGAVGKGATFYFTLN
jgi:PAS domain S-box-containing protein